MHSRAVWRQAWSCCKMISFFPECFVTLCTTKLLEHLEVTSSTDFLLWEKLNSYASFSIPEDSPHILQAVGTVFGLFSLGDVHVMTSHALSFCFWTKVITPLFIPCSLCMTQGTNSSIISLRIKCEDGTKSTTQTTHTNC